jgi:F420-non-reducing hydrogenase iron-sulfur subunit
MKPVIVIFCCTNAAAVPEDEVERINATPQAAVKFTRLPCSGRTDVLYILRAVEEGADMAMVVACPNGACQFLEGNRRARLRVSYANRLLAESGLGNERVRLVNLAPDDPQGFVDALQETITRARKLGPWGVA